MVYLCVVLSWNSPPWTGWFAGLKFSLAPSGWALYTLAYSVSVQGPLPCDKWFVRLCGHLCRLKGKNKPSAYLIRLTKLNQNNSLSCCKIIKRQITLYVCVYLLVKLFFFADFQHISESLY